MKKPVVDQIAKLYSVAETTLWQYIKNPGQLTIDETIQKTQALNVVEEAVLVKRQVFLDHANILAD